MIFFIPYRLHLFQLSLNICNAQSCLSPHASQHHESWSPKILLLLGTSSSLLQMGLLVLHIRISHKSDLNHFVVMTNMMSKLSAPLQNNTMLGLDFGYAPIIINILGQVLIFMLIKSFICTNSSSQLPNSIWHARRETQERLRNFCKNILSPHG